MEDTHNIPLLNKIQLLKTSVSPSVGVSIKSEKKFGLKEEHTIICKNCRNIITTSDKMLTVNGNHRHTCINPAGLTFQIVCFSSAEGCVVYGKPTDEHTWFKDFGWSLCICSNCLMHMGWFYTNGEDSFFGLILDLLDEITKQI